MDKKRLIYIPLGGAGEIGMNTYVYGYGAPGKEEYIVVDTGVSFPRLDTSPGTDLVIADLDFLKANKDKICGVFVTHAHEDHVGAIPYFYEIFGCPIYCNEFTAYIARNKLISNGLESKKLRITSCFPAVVEAGAFRVSFISIPHSVPEASSLLIETPAGRVLHTGDLKIDYSPVLGKPFQDKILKKIGNDGILALVCDSTNVFSMAEGRSESSIKENLISFINSQSGMIGATTFASNIARLYTLVDCARQCGREVLIIGRAMHSMLSAALATGVLKNFPPTLTTHEAQNIHRSKLFVVATGSQGEIRAVSAQLSKGSYQGINMGQGDSFLFSSKTIPGNELAVGKVINDFVARGVTVFEDVTGDYHVSGHANRPDLLKIHAMIRPKVLIPMHGEHRHLAEHCNLANIGGFNSIFAINGSVVEISRDGNASIVDKIKVGKVFVEGDSLIEAEDGVIKARLQMANRGHISASILIEEGKIIDNGIWVKSKGLPKKLDQIVEFESSIENSIEEEFSYASKKDILDDDRLEALVKTAINKICRKEIKRKPLITIFINRLQ